MKIFTKAHAKLALGAIRGHGFRVLVVGWVMTFFSLNISSGDTVGRAVDFVSNQALAYLTMVTG